MNSTSKRPAKSGSQANKYEVTEGSSSPMATKVPKTPKSGDLNNIGFSSVDFFKAKTTKFRDEYTVKDQVGQGAFGEVRKVIHKVTGMTRAAKILRKDAIDATEHSKLISEVQILTTLDHPYILKVFEMFEDKNKYYIVTEYLEGGELFDRIIENDHFSEKDAAKIMQQLLSAVAYCHSHNIVHRDLKPENLVYESKKRESNLKVIDFGTAKDFKPNQKMSETFGTAYYIAPEILNQNYTEKCDVWSCGVILYILLTGTPPFPGKDDREILRKVKVGKYSFDDPAWLNVSDEAKRFIKRMMEVDPNRRVSAPEALNDTWFTKAMEKQEVDRPLAIQNLTNLKNFGFESKLQEATWVYLVSYFATKEEKEKLLETFKALDVDHDGQLTKEELRLGYMKIMGMSNELAEEEAERIMRTIDTNNNGSIDYSEFVNATISKANLLKKERLEAAFKVFDRNGDGKISADEMRFLFNEGKTHGIPEKVWEEWINQVDKNADGGISIDEFREMMVSLMSHKV